MKIAALTSGSGSCKDGAQPLGGDASETRGRATRNRARKQGPTVRSPKFVSGFGGLCEVRTT